MISFLAALNVFLLHLLLIIVNYFHNFFETTFLEKDNDKWDSIALLTTKSMVHARKQVFTVASRGFNKGGCESQRSSHRSRSKPVQGATLQLLGTGRCWTERSGGGPVELLVGRKALDTALP